MRRLLAVALVLVALAVTADRGTLALVQRRLAAQVQQQERLDHRPTVRLRGFPFLTQVVRGRYEGAVVTLTDLPDDRLPVRRLSVDLRDVRLPVRILLDGKVESVPVREVTGTAGVTFADLAAATKINGLRISALGDRIALILPITQFGQTIRLGASAAVVVNRGELQIVDGKIEGVSLPPAVNGVLRQLSRALPLDHLPYGLRLTGVKVTPGGLDVTAAARNVVLRSPTG